jgi:hypothetical protein
MTPNQRLEEISKAYVAAVAAACGFKLGSWSQDDDCLDVTLGATGRIGRGFMQSPKLDLQLKCSADPRRRHRDGGASWELSRSHYDLLRSRQRATPLILVVLLLPEDEADQITHTLEALTLRRCAWWLSLAGRPALQPIVRGDQVAERTSTTVHLPEDQPFSPAGLRALMERISAGEDLT